MKQIKKKLILHRTFSMIIGLLVGVLLLVISGILTENTVSTIIKWAIIVYGVFIIIGNIPGLIDGISNAHKMTGVFDIIMSALGIILGISMIIFQNSILVAIVAAYLIIFPLLRVLLADRKGEQFKHELLTILLGVVLLVFVPSLVGAAFKLIHVLLMVVGWIVIVLSLLLGIISLIYIARMPMGENEAPKEHIRHEKDHKEDPSSAQKNLYVDWDGDGTIDEVIPDDRNDQDRQ